MIVTFLKNHGKYKADETADIPDKTAMFLLRCSVATVKEPDEKSVDKTLIKQLKKTKKKK